MKLLFLILLTLYPRLGQSCSCKDISNRLETLRDGICWGDVYSGVVLGATCSCNLVNGTYDCRQYSYSPNANSYASRVLTRVELLNSDSPFFDEFLKTCTQAGNILADGEQISLDAESVPEVVTRNSTDYGALVCPFNDENNPETGICRYSVRVTEVFIGNNITVGDLVISPGPDTLTSCAAEEGRILQLNTAYLAGVGGPCSAINDWEPLSEYSEDDLNFLREFAAEVKENDALCDASQTSVHVLSLMFMTAMAAVLCNVVAI